MVTDIDEAFDHASRHFQAGRLKEAVQIYQQILESHPDHPRALHALGVISFRSGNGEAAFDLIKRAVAIKPDFADAYNNLGNVYKEMGRGRGNSRISACCCR
jgi:Flp pilus assembly protein TadD